jgi:hypothetical protein
MSRDRSLATPVEERLLRAQRWLVALAASTLTLAVGLAVQAARSTTASELSLRPDVKEAAVRHLVADGSGVWDSFPDPDVARLLQPGLHERRFGPVDIESNDLGLRERPFSLPKEEGVVRVIVLGDSFVFGAGVEEEDRVGVFLERHLRERAGAEPSPRVECLHLGVGSWNLRSEVAFLRRLATPLAPDLVIHVVVANDLNDTGDVRGFGAVSDFTSQHRERTTSIYTAFPIWELGRGFKKTSRLNEALSYESRNRYAEASRDLAVLARTLRRQGASYLVLLSWEHQPEIAARHLTADLDEESVLYLPASFRRNRENRLSRSDPHWSRTGHDRVAQFLYGAIRARRLLPSLQLRDWPEATSLFERLRAEGADEALTPFDPERLAEQLAARIDLAGLDERAARQIYGGVYGDGMVAPYASLLLPRREGTRIRIVGHSLARPELRDVTVNIFADEILVGRLAVPPSGAIEALYQLPRQVIARPSFDVRFVTGDYVYDPKDIRRCVVFRLDLLEVLP